MSSCQAFHPNIIKANQPTILNIHNPIFQCKDLQLMPEGHTIHRLARDHTKWFARQRLKISSPQGRFAQESLSLDGRILKSVEAHGKHLYYQFVGKRVLHIHLGLYGKYRLHRTPPPEPRGAVRVRFVGPIHALDLVGPNQCEILTVQQAEESRAKLGEDPLRPDADPDRVWSRLHKSKKPIGAALLDQSIIAGIGNIYRAEILFLLQIHPTRPCNSLTKNEFDELWQRSIQLLEVGVKYNRIITVQREHVDKSLGKLNAAERLWIYKKEFCPKCATQVVSWSLGNRQIYACPVCQGSADIQ